MKLFKIIAIFLWIRNKFQDMQIIPCLHQVSRGPPGDKRHFTRLGQDPVSKLVPMSAYPTYTQMHCQMYFSTFSLSLVFLFGTILACFMSVSKLEANLIVEIVKILKPFMKLTTTKRALFFSRKNQHDVSISRSFRPGNLCALRITNAFISVCLPDIDK